MNAVTQLSKYSPEEEPLVTKKRKRSATEQDLIGLYGQTVAQKILQKAQRSLAKRIKIDFISYFPEELIQKILSHLNFKSLPNAVQTCSTFYRLGMHKDVYPVALKKFVLNQALTNIGKLTGRVRVFQVYEIFLACIKKNDLTNAKEVLELLWQYYVQDSLKLDCLKKTTGQTELQDLSFLPQPKTDLKKEVDVDSLRDCKRLLSMLLNTAHCKIAILKAKLGQITESELYLSDINEADHNIIEVKIDVLLEHARHYVTKVPDLASKILEEALRISTSNNFIKSHKIIELLYKLNPDQARRVVDSCASAAQAEGTKLKLLKVEAKDNLEKALERAQKNFIGLDKVKALLALAQTQVTTNPRTSWALLLQAQELLNSLAAGYDPHFLGTYSCNLAFLMACVDLKLTGALGESLNALISLEALHTPLAIETYKRLVRHLSKTDKPLATAILKFADSLFQNRVSWQTALFTFFKPLLDDPSARSFFLEILKSREFTTEDLTALGFVPKLDSELIEGLQSALDRSVLNTSELNDSEEEDAQVYFEALLTFNPRRVLQEADETYQSLKPAAIACLAQENPMEAIQAVIIHLKDDYHKAEAYAEILKYL